MAQRRAAGRFDDGRAAQPDTDRQGEDFTVSIIVSVVGTVIIVLFLIVM
jgi:hypothetical protein